MPTNFDTNATDLEDVFAPRSWFKLGPALFAWGSGSFGGTGLNSDIPNSSPVQIGSLTNWWNASAGNLNGAAIKTDFTLWTWGDGSTGQLGVNSTINRSSPVQVGTLTDWYQISIGGTVTIGVKTNGTLWSWGGGGGGGTLGLNSTNNRSSPVQVGSLQNWKQVSNGGHVLAVKIDGTLWSWGQNFNGATGLNTSTYLTNRSSPVQVGSLQNWLNVAASGNASWSAAIKTDGTLWTWGKGLNGRLGLNNEIDRSSPVQVGTLTDWKQVGPSYYTCIAVKTNGTLWSWGSNLGGGMGLNNTIFTSSPTQVGTLSNWRQTSTYGGWGGGAPSGAIKTDGTLWIWGAAADGKLGLNNTIYRSSPIQLGSLTNWRAISLTGYGELGILDITDIN
jgi:alpha-tubulin suppressor-like RCC1 family protein